jgi:hypothetical protein
MSRCAGYIRLDAPSCWLCRPAIHQHAQVVDERVDSRFQRDGVPSDLTSQEAALTAASRASAVRSTSAAGGSSPRATAAARLTLISSSQRANARSSSARASGRQLAGQRPDRTAADAALAAHRLDHHVPPLGQRGDAVDLRKRQFLAAEDRIALVVDDGGDEVPLVQLICGSCGMLEMRVATVTRSATEAVSSGHQASATRQGSRSWIRTKTTPGRL